MNWSATITGITLSVAHHFKVSYVFPFPNQVTYCAPLVDVCVTTNPIEVIPVLAKGKAFASALNWADHNDPIQAVLTLFGG